jgi:nitrate/nitrite transport system substrate-binding protein
MENKAISNNTSRQLSRRDVLRFGLASTAAALGIWRQRAWATGSDKPEKQEVSVGFIPLTDCASVVVAAELGFDRKYGIKIVPAKQASWAVVRDKLINGEIDAAHTLYGLVYGVRLGIGGPQRDLVILMTLNHNGQGITLSNRLKAAGAVDGTSLKKLVDQRTRSLTFAQTFPTGTHAMWLYYWLAAHEIHPFADVKTITVPPPQMVANMRVGNMDGYCVGEPWNARAIVDNVGFTALLSQDIWPDHPEKVLSTRLEFVGNYPNTARALIAAILEASKYIDTMANRGNVAQIIAQKAYVNTEVSVIKGRMKGEYENGLGKKWQDPNYMKFYNDGKVNFPYPSDGMWFLAQFRRWGLLKDDLDYLALAKQVNQVELYKEAAAMANVPVPTDEMRSAKFFDGSIWDGRDAKSYAASFKIRA